MRTKAYHAFESKLHYFDDDIDLVDVLRLNIISGELTDDESDNVFKKVCPTRHSHLARRKNSDGSRKLLILHLRSTIYSSYIKDVYEEVTEYLRTILALAAENGFESGRLIGEHSFKIDAKEVLLAGDWTHISRKIADSVFQALESEKSTLKLIQKISNKLALNIDADLINNALPYLEIRHLLVHTDGKASQEFKDKYPIIRLKGDSVFINHVLVTRMRDAVKSLIKAFDDAVIQNNIVAQQYTQP